MSDINVLLIPGLLNTKDMWAGLIDVLNPKLPPGTTFLYGDTRHHDNIEAITHQIITPLEKKDTILIGFSMGGYISLDIMRSSFAPHIKGLVLIDTSARSEKEAAVQGRSFIISSLERGQASFKGLGKEAVKKVIHTSHHHKEDMIEYICAMSRTFDSSAYLKQLLAVFNRKDQRDYLPHISVPTLILCGENDTITPPHLSQEIASLIPHSCYYSIPACGHHAPLEQTHDVAHHIITWMASHFTTI